jgi:hypothetical protein
MKIKHLLRLLQAADDKEKEVWIPSIENDRTTNIGFNFDDINNLELYEIGGEYDEKYTVSRISNLEKLYIRDKVSLMQIELKELEQKLSTLEK